MVINSNPVKSLEAPRVDRMASNNVTIIYSSLAVLALAKARLSVFIFSFYLTS